jgi:hypothetical protein
MKCYVNLIHVVPLEFIRMREISAQISRTSI